MSHIGYDLSQYPLNEHYSICRQYMFHSMDWEEIADSIRVNRTIGVDVSDTISLFSHLDLDPEYQLICYMTAEYHGIFGQVAAVKKGDDWNPKRDADKEPHQFFNKLHMPECTLPPMEAIFNDGSAEGYFEAVLCALFLHALPYARFEQKHWPIIISATPGDFDEKWDYQIALSDWKPRYSERSIIVLRREVENGIGSSSGKDRIYLSRFSFHRNVNESLFASVLRTQRPASPNHITSSNRYSETKRCCVFTQTSILVAEEK